MARKRLSFYERLLNPNRKRYKWIADILFKIAKSSGIIQISINTAVWNKRAVAVYDCKYYPETYDFAHFMYLATCRMGEKNIREFEVIIIGAESSGNLRETAMQDRISTILMPIAQRWSECTKVSYINDRKYIKLLCRRTKNLFPERYDGIFFSWIDWVSVYDYARRNTEYKGIKATNEDLEVVKQWLKVNRVSERFITLTIRQSRVQPERNTDLSMYFDLAEWFRECSYDVVVLPDTENIKIDSLEKNNKIFYQGSFSLTQRNALYEMAYTNVIGSNGPATVMMLNKNISFIIHGFKNDIWTKERLQERGLYVGDQLWTENNSLWVWEEDNLDNLKRAFRLREAKKNI